jgi:GAF domain-containing protein
MPRTERGAEERWRQVLSVLARESGYERRLDALLDLVAELGGLPSGHLYLLDEGGRRFHLQRSRLPAGTHGVQAGGGLEGGAGSVTPAPPLELPRTPADEGERTVDTPAGRLRSLPLALDGELLGLLQLGPVDNDLPRHARHALEPLRFPLALALQRARDEHALRQQLDAALARIDVSRRLEGSALDLDRFVDLLLELALRSTRTEAGFVATVDPNGGPLALRSHRGLTDGVAEQLDLSPETGLFDWSPAAEGGALVLRDFETASRLGFRSLLAVPLLDGDVPLGVFALVNFGESGTFDEDSLELLETYAEQIKLMLRNARLFESFAEEYLATVKSLARSLDARRALTRGHHERMAAVAEALARELGLPGDEVEAIRTAALIHDVGLAGVVEAEAYIADIAHPTIGAGLVAHLPLHPFVAEAIAAHHEWFDGWGFPHGLKGEEIPLGGRVLGAAELLVELGTGDAVRGPMPLDGIAAELDVRSGSQLDPRVAAAAARALPRLPLYPIHEKETA